MKYEHELHLALKLARQASRVVLRYYRQRSRVRLKSNETPVTAADRAVERILVEGILRSFPHDRIVGEEHGSVGERRGRFWTIDPIDGTSHFIRKNGSFGTMIALIDHGRSVLGVIAAPVMQKIFYAVAGHGCFVIHGTKRKKIHVRRVDDFRQARLIVPLIRKKRHTFNQRARDALGLRRRVPRGGIGLAICGVAEGKADVFIGASLLTGVWDAAPCDIIVREAGGVVQTLAGQPVRFRWGQWHMDRGFISATPELMPTVVQRLQEHDIPRQFLRERRRHRRLASQAT